MAALVAASASVLPASAAELGNGSASCIGTMTLTFSTPLTLFPAVTSFGINGGATGCVGGGSVSWNGSGLMSVSDDDCLVIEGTGSATFNFPTGTATVMVAGGGLSLLQSWTFADASLNVEASGLFTWINVPQIEGCVLGPSGTMTMTLTGVITVVT